MHVHVIFPATCSITTFTSLSRFFFGSLPLYFLLSLPPSSQHKSRLPAAQWTTLRSCQCHLISKSFKSPKRETKTTINRIVFEFQCIALLFIIKYFVWPQCRTLTSLTMRKLFIHSNLNCSARCRCTTTHILIYIYGTCNIYKRICM